MWILFIIDYSSICTGIGNFYQIELKKRTLYGFKKVNTMYILFIIDYREFA